MQILTFLCYLFLTRYHQAVIPSRSALVFFEVKPEQGKSLEVYVDYKTRPTLKKHVFSAITPNTNYCNQTKSALNCSAEAYVIVLSSAVTGHIGLHYVGVRYPGPKNDNPASSEEMGQGKGRIRRGCDSHGGRQKRSCIGVKDLPTTPTPTPKIIIPRYNESTDVNYTTSATVTNCLYWSEPEQAWTDDGCKVNSFSHSWPCCRSNCKSNFIIQIVVKLVVMVIKTSQSERLIQRSVMINRVVGIKRLKKKNLPFSTLLLI